MTKQNLEKILLKSFQKFDKEVVSLNKQQLADGEDNEGDLFGRYKAGTQQIAESPLADPRPRKDKVAGQPFNFEWSGGLFDGMYLRSTPSYVEIWSKDSKTPLLNIEYPGLFGLNDENMAIVIQKWVYPDFMTEIRKLLEI